MTNLVEPRRAAGTENDAGLGSLGDGELTTLVRRWMAAGTKVQERVRRESVVRPGPEPEPASEAPTETEPEAFGAETETEPQAAGGETESVEAEAETAGEEEAVAGRDTADTTGVAPEPELLAVARLPHRPTPTDVEQATRVAVLIDARRVPEDVATALLARLAERGAVNVCRAYADWTRADLGDWVARMRLQGLHSFHQFSDDDEQALVALAIDAVDIARDAAVDEVVVAGDMTSLLPLVHRLHAAGVRVVVVGPGHTPHDVRAACDEFWDSESIGADELAPAGRHRA
ncbi:hypothetical protein ASC64_03325 [Nocardioides sp. Root122]|uniref:NYN domain-containing protein n=1 Tax=Nocardioides TaxID=1839 RepID=UPI0007032E40|nr:MULTISPECIES: NYN domain-containing protein [Nocardioides]KQV77860.1 hypothetical protein ASC64_03325 [Nocardioides sp. Root122]MCK9822342.1 NYN domain-containing protein [Nocardioides cavernae]